MQLNITNFNILLLPGAQVKDVYKFPSKKDFYDTVVLFNEVNDVFSSRAQSDISATELVREISDLANLFLTTAKKSLYLESRIVNTKTNVQKK